MTKKKIPFNSIKSGPINLKVKTSGEALKHLGDDKDGRLVVDEELIVASPDQTDTMLAMTLIHELIHNSLRPLDLKYKTEEKICLQLERDIYGIITENPEFIEWIISTSE